MAGKKNAAATDPFLDRLEKGQAPAWKPEVGGVLVGTIMEYRTGTSKHPKLPDTYPIAIVKDEKSGDEFAVHIVLTAIRSKFESAQPQVGERIGITYRGKRESASGAEYHDYDLIVDRKEAALNPFQTFADVAATTAAPVDSTEDVETDADGLPL